MIDYIILGEFDINEGNVVRLEYPNKIGISDMILSSYIIPEGTHNIMTDSFCFIVNKTNLQEDIIPKKIKPDDEKNKEKDKDKNINNNNTKGFMRYFNLERPLRELKIENKIYKIKQVHLFNKNTNEWIPLQSFDLNMNLNIGQNKNKENDNKNDKSKF